MSPQQMAQRTKCYDKGKKDTCTLLLEIQTGKATIVVSVALAQKPKNKISMGPSSINPGYTSRGFCVKTLSKHT